MKPSEILPSEAELGRELGTSRTVVREAVKSLAGKELLYDTGLPLHGRVFDAIRDHHPEQARENMAQLLTGTREFLEGELAGPVRDGADKPRTAAP